ncbi:hypothetical protein PsorP6_010641 [Peronosclerospora sorghi]|uniref:Uncharacterized protein n=1 Tax=Peronosclerospora sorghi TaxID=230839 RepID=A0ACC0VU54_9STRA|nr:hypothetical protein PsorP6_010641 [Peronosclerospora sorghi]
MAVYLATCIIIEIDQASECGPTEIIFMNEAHHLLFLVQADVRMRHTAYPVNVNPDLRYERIRKHRAKVLTPTFDKNLRYASSIFVRHL